MAPYGNQDPTRAHTRWWATRPPDRARASTKVCPKCKTRGPLRLYAGQICAACKALRAWSRLGARGRLVIDRASIEAAMKHRRGEASGGPRWQRLLVWAIPATTLASAGVAAGFLVHLLVLPLFESWQMHHAITAVAMRRATMFGLVTLLLGVVALVHVRQSPQFRRLSISACHLIAIVVGGAALVVGTLLYLVALGDEVSPHELPRRLNDLRMPTHSSPGSGPFQRQAGTSEILIDPPDRGEFDTPDQAEPPTGR